MKIPCTPASILSALFLSLILTIFSCKKETSNSLSAQDEEQANITATQSDVEAESVFDGILNDALGVNTDVGFGGTGIFGRTISNNYETGVSGRIDNTTIAPSCLITTIEHTTTSFFPVKITLDFGAGCLCTSDGHFRKGKIIITYSNRLLIPGASALVSFHGFSIDSIYIDNSSTHSITNTGTQDKLQFTVDVQAKLSKPNGNYSEWHSHKVITRIEGNQTNSLVDDIFQIEGYTYGKAKRNDLLVAWNAEITSPLIKKFTCPWISQGTVRIARENLSANSQWVGILDYGVGNCDKYATLTIKNVGHEITLR